MSKKTSDGESRDESESQGAADPPAKGRRARERDERKDRLSAALKANLRRRKSQARGRDAAK